jgi:hypothetical protein
MPDAADIRTEPPRRRFGLAFRAACFVSGLFAIIAILASGTVMFGFERESQRHQLESATEVVRHAAQTSGPWLSEGKINDVGALAARMASRPGTLSLSVFDANERLAASGGESRSPLPRQLAARALVIVLSLCVHTNAHSIARHERVKLMLRPLAR